MGFNRNQSFQQMRRYVSGKYFTVFPRNESPAMAGVRSEGGIDSICNIIIVLRTYCTIPNNTIPSVMLRTDARRWRPAISADVHPVWMCRAVQYLYIQDMFIHRIRTRIIVVPPVD
jgi:hypothetical protein